MKYVIRKSFTFEAAHQLEDAVTAACHECVHGHSYKVEVFLSRTILDRMEMVLDFGTLKGFKEMIMEEWDHGLILHERKRPYFQPLIEAGVLKREKVTFLSINPTAEAMATILYQRLKTFLGRGILGSGVSVEAVRVHETSTGWAEYQASGTITWGGGV